MGVCEAGYCFTVIDVGQSGSNSDGGIWEASVFDRALEKVLCG